MLIHESGVSDRSVRYFFTPSSFAEHIFYYPTRVGHYFCDRTYHFSHLCEIARQESHHMNYMLMFVRQGRLSFTVEGQTGTLRREDCVLFDCQRPHEYYAMTDNLEFYWLLFNGSESARFYQTALAMHGGRHSFHLEDAAQVQLPFDRLLTNGEFFQRASERECSEAIYSILCQLIRAEGQEREGDSQTSQALAMMDLHYTERLSIADVARHIGLSPSYFTKQFRAQTGYSPYEYLTLRRIQRAKELLLSTALTVRQIAFEIGYNSEENFIRAFQKKVGSSPTGFRKYNI